MEECQNSNFGFYNNQIEASSDIVHANTPEGIVQYQVIGKTIDDIFVVFFNGNIAAYEIKEVFIKPDLFRDYRIKQHVLSVIVYTFVPCFQKGRIEKNTLIIEKNVYNPDAPSSEQCTKVLEKIKYTIKK